jgi:hypothetical protein
LKVGGIFQNPAFILLNYLGPEKYEGFELTTYITAAVLLFTTVLSFTSIAKLVSSQILIGIQTFITGFDLEIVLMYELKVLFLQWLPEFIYYVLPALGTSAYFMTIDI